LAAWSDVDRRGRGLQVRVAGQVTAVVHHQMNRVAVAADKGPAPVVQAHAVLTAAAGQLEGPTARLQEQAVAAHRHRPGVFLVRGPHLTTVKAGADVDAVVRAPAEGVQLSLARLVLAEAGEDRLSQVRLASAFGLLAVEEVRRGADENAIIITLDGRGVI